MLRLVPAFQRLALRSLCSAAAASQQSVSKEALMKLRKKTGYSYLNCRKALLQFGDNNLADAEKYLRDLAEKEGWEKAAKVSGRETSQGLVSVYVNENMAAVVELKSETDFVARNEVFKQLVEELTLAVHEFGKVKKDQMLQFGEENFKCRISKGELPFEYLKFALERHYDELQTPKNRTVKEALAMTIGKLGENITLARAEVHLPPPGYEIQGYSHPNDGTEIVEMGRFVSLISLRRSDDSSGFPTENLAKQICQHIIGMDPKELGTPATDADLQEKVQKEAEFKQKLKERIQTEKAAAGKEYTSNEEDALDSPFVDDDETRLLHQSFMMNPTMSVHDYLSSHGTQLSAFMRIKLGEQSEEKEKN